MCLVLELALDLCVLFNLLKSLFVAAIVVEQARNMRGIHYVKRILSYQILIFFYIVALEKRPNSVSSGVLLSYFAVTVSAIWNMFCRCRCIVVYTMKIFFVNIYWILFLIIIYLRVIKYRTKKEILVKFWHPISTQW